jgi:hypothetical protein
MFMCARCSNRNWNHSKKIRANCHRLCMMCHHCNVLSDTISFCNPGQHRLRFTSLTSSWRLVTRDTWSLLKVMYLTRIWETVFESSARTYYPEIFSNIPSFVNSRKIQYSVLTAFSQILSNFPFHKQLICNKGHTWNCVREEQNTLAMRCAWTCVLFWYYLLFFKLFSM